MIPPATLGIGGVGTPILVVIALLLVTLIGVTWWTWRQFTAARDQAPALEAQPDKPSIDATDETGGDRRRAVGVDGAERTDDPDDRGEIVEMDPPRFSRASFGIGQELYRLYRVHRKRRKLAKKGYVQWYLIESVWPTPKFVKPERDGKGVPRVEHDGQEYLFPQDARAPSEQQGMWTYIHKKGDAVPINLETPGKPPIDADRLRDYLDMGVSSTPPSLLGRLDLDPEDLIMIGVGGIVLWGILKQVGVV